MRKMTKKPVFEFTCNGCRKTEETSNVHGPPRWNSIEITIGPSGANPLPGLPGKLVKQPTTKTFFGHCCEFCSTRQIKQIEEFGFELVTPEDVLGDILLDG